MSTPVPLTVSYTSSNNAPFTVSLPQTTPTPISTSTNAVEAKQQYLSQLRQSVLSFQDRVNKELTSRMEEDNARAGTAANGADNKEEENYGEEVVEED
ncbi:hypothetical protein QBC36DRAFT_81391 [Triangularia setosa]|uniref:EKC/KEOPS complex subunit GON7 n=1 Tax=Triangularia setosa TaxID=2587417 RepID=A0AAN7A3P4_9PEZI|nr:hypothetical protein QBC36DRAFT_81391 [Podospora setosa]